MGNSLGSSPRIRGKLTPASAAACATGLIPAHTGKTSHVYPSRLACGAHPRAYGENGYFGNVQEMEAGSSPRIRGKLHLARVP